MKTARRRAAPSRAKATRLPGWRNDPIARAFSRDVGGDGGRHPGGCVGRAQARGPHRDRQGRLPAGPRRDRAAARHGRRHRQRPVVIGVERQLRCTCGCTLDIYTCRTTDFTCTYSPALHKEVVGLVEQGKTPEEVIAFFVQREGEKILMAPVAQGFNLAGYLVPGLGIAVAGLMLAAYLSRRREAVAVPAGGSAPPPAPDAEAIERLKRALDEVES